MKCPVCNNEMEKGKSFFTSMQGLGQMILSFTSDEEAKKGLFKRQSALPSSFFIDRSNDGTEY